MIKENKRFHEDGQEDDYIKERDIQEDD